jgi:hypothetical protein
MRFDQNSLDQCHHHTIMGRRLTRSTVEIVSMTPPDQPLQEAYPTHFPHLLSGFPDVAPKKYSHSWTCPLPLLTAFVLMSGVRGIWSVKTSAMSEYDQYLIITFVGSTHVLAMNANDELDEATVNGFVTDKMTLFCGSVNTDHVLQVRRESLYGVRPMSLLHVPCVHPCRHWFIRTCLVETTVIK